MKTNKATGPAQLLLAVGFQQNRLCFTLLSG